MNISLCSMLKQKYFIEFHLDVFDKLGFSDFEITEFDIF